MNEINWKRWIVTGALMIVSTPSFSQNVQQRRHYTVESARLGVKYAVTTVHSSPNSTEDRAAFLVQDQVNEDRLILSSYRDYLEQTTTLEVLDLQTKERISAVVKWPYKSVTRAETLIEMSKVDTTKIVPVVTLEAGGVSVLVDEAAWEDALGRERRSEVRRAASSAFLERLERLRPVVGSHGDMVMFCAGLLKFVLYHESCNGPLSFKPATPSCEFDLAFGYRCSDEQKERLRSAAESNRELSVY